jgi:hypothetical protein
VMGVLGRHFERRTAAQPAFRVQGRSNEA